VIDTGGLVNGILLQILITFAIVGALTAVLVVVLRRTMFGGGRADRARAEHLQQHGAKARAMILAVQPTGTIVNHIYLRCVVRFRLEPIDGGAAFETEKTMMLAQTGMPRVGDVWPAWFEPTNPQQCAVAQVNALTSDQIPMFREFGIPHPLDGPSSGPPPG
jgi:hypothetical protein